MSNEIPASAAPETPDAHTAAASEMANIFADQTNGAQGDSQGGAANVNPSQPGTEGAANATRDGTAGALANKGQDGTANAAREGSEGASQGTDEAAAIDYEHVDLGIDSPNAYAAGEFRNLAKELGLRPEQMRKLAQFEARMGEAVRGEMVAAGQAELRQAWGPNYEANRQLALKVISRADMATNGAFSAALERCGAACDKDFVLGLVNLGQYLNEDSAPLSGAAAMPAKTETALEGLEAIFNRK